MKHFLRIFSIFLAITFSLNASKSYGQTGVTINIQKEIVCPGEELIIKATSEFRTYPYVLIYVSTDNVSFEPYFIPNPNFGVLRILTYDPTDDVNTTFTFQTDVVNTSTSMRRVYYKMALWTSNPPVGDPSFSNTDYVDVRPSANVQNGFNNANQRVCINSAALPISPISPVGTTYS